VSAAVTLGLRLRRIARRSRSRGGLCAGLGRRPGFHAPSSVSSYEGRLKLIFGHAQCSRAYTSMTQHNDTPAVPTDSQRAPRSQAKSFVRQHRLALFGGGLLTIVAVAGIANAGPGAGHTTCCIGHHHEDATVTPNATATPDPSGKVTVTVDGRGFHPSSIELTKGQRATLEFRRTSDETCATSVVFPELKLEKALPLNQVVAIELPADASGTLTFQCGMGMYHGKVVVH
jgi:hypothetical protein